MAETLTFHSPSIWDKRSISRMKCKIKNATYPVPIKSLPLMIMTVTAIHFVEQHDSNSGDVVRLISLNFNTSPWESCLIAGFLSWLTVVITIRFTIRLLLQYQGWMYEKQPTKPSLATKLWAFSLKILLLRQKPALYSFQSLLPRLPVPRLDATIDQYLKSMKPLLESHKYDQLVTLSRDFKQNLGSKLQRYLYFKSWWSENYVTDWWEKYVYLSNRSPLLVNSNVYGLDHIYVHPTKLQAARAAYLIHALLRYRELVESQQLDPIVIQGVLPLCSYQYKRYFNSARIPGMEIDEIVHYDDSGHVAVYHKGRYFRVPIYHKNRILQPSEIELQIQSVLDDKSSPYEGEEKLASVTALNRSEWAKIRKQFLSTGINQYSLQIVESAAFFVALDDFSYEDQNGTSLTDFSRTTFCGNGYNRWCDKTFCVGIGTNGRACIHVEHSWADGLVPSHGWEYVLGMELLNGYNEDGHTKGLPEFPPPAPIRLNWDFNLECLEAIEKSALLAKELIAGVDLFVYTHDDYGKGFMKKVKVSPDAYIQMALQLAFYRDIGKLALTYESTMTRLYREGRTETLRSCTQEMAAWIKSMNDAKSSVEERRQLLMDTAARHKKNYQDAMCGKGIDRHLFSLYVVSKYLQVDSPFLKEVFTQPWQLSTSQTPQNQLFKMDSKRYPEVITGGGGFGPVDENGYGVSYIVGNEDVLFFHISSKHASTETDSKRFGGEVSKALADMKKLLQ
ncbi:carnitine O-palmitoyltransferase 1, muscle isoform-like [Phymastichus coffea]|uniref:carnitine O-palmitoyltransferase 1, muscle isoform-like n=1 Tax=Phymastichus coffea TaxID=108790 RepID=UPI00273C8E6E|nr:carnitine O-palmitoyltransferase 1, muscle isoform-like [Phymastichus coffea]